MKNKKPWTTRSIPLLELKFLGFKETNQLDASRKFVKNINIFVKFYYHDMNSRKLMETPLYYLDKSILKNLQFLKDNQISAFTAFDFIFRKIKIQEIFPHAIMDTFIYTDDRTKTPRSFIEDVVIPSNKNQSFLNFN